MEVFGYSQKDVEQNDLLTMQEICLELSLEEIDELILFLRHVRQRHESVSDIAYCPHTHYSEWKQDFNNIKPEIVISTVFSQNEPRHITI